MTNRHIVDRVLPDRSKLKFYFPVAQKGNENYVVDLPFFENIEVKESKRANLQKYSLIARSSSLYSYLGAESRKLDVSFSMSLPHLVEDHPEINIDRYITSPAVGAENTDTEKKRFTQPFTPKSSRSGAAFRLGTEYTQSLARESARQVIQSDWFKNAIPIADREMFYTNYGLSEPGEGGFGEKIRDIQSGLGSIFPSPAPALSQALSFSFDVNEGLLKLLKTIDLIVYWVNIVRSSVVNNADNPLYGPPIIRLNHGIMYQDIPCICTSYSISHEEEAGYDLRTLLPRKIMISLRLEEVRAGNYKKFDPTNAISRDNLAGWESVVLGETNSMDPGSGGV